MANRKITLDPVDPRSGKALSEEELANNKPPERFGKLSSFIDSFAGGLSPIGTEGNDLAGAGFQGVLNAIGNEDTRRFPQPTSEVMHEASRDNKEARHAMEEEHPYISGAGRALGNVASMALGAGATKEFTKRGLRKEILQEIGDNLPATHKAFRPQMMEPTEAISAEELRQMSPDQIRNLFRGMRDRAGIQQSPMPRMMPITKS